VHFQLQVNIISKKKGYEALDINWSPKLYLSYSGNSNLTSESISHVNQIWKKEQAHAKSIDELMSTASINARAALADKSEDNFNLLKDSINNANQCFTQWKLITPQLDIHINMLKSLGAIACKPIGAGLGGYVLSLWKNEPSSPPFELMPAL